MMADGAGGIDFELVPASGVRDELPENDLGGGRPANIAQADEKNAER